jgi:nucleoid DNA-binding protein
MNKAKLVRAISDDLQVVPDRCAELLECVLKHMAAGIAADGELRLPHFGYFTVAKTKPWSTVGLHGEGLVQYPAKRRVSFKPARGLKETVWAEADRPAGGSGYGRPV